MSSVISKRIEKLEAKATGNGNQIQMIVRRIVSCDSNGEANCAEYGDTVIHRLPDETESEFIERSGAEFIAAGAKGCFRMIVSELDVDL